MMMLKSGVTWTPTPAVLTSAPRLKFTTWPHHVVRLRHSALSKGSPLTTHSKTMLRFKAMRIHVQDMLHNQGVSNSIVPMGLFLALSGLDLLLKEMHEAILLLPLGTMFHPLVPE